MDGPPTENHLRSRFLVESAGLPILEYSCLNWGPWDSSAPAADVPAVRNPECCTVEEVVTDLLRHFHDPFPPDYLSEPERRFYGDSLGGRDLAIWRDGRLLAIIRVPRDGAPIPTVFRD